MNPVTVSNELMRQWLDLCGMTTRASVELYAEASRQALSIWGIQKPTVPLTPTWPVFWSNPFLGPSGATVHPMQFAAPWLSLAMPQSTWSLPVWPAATFGTLTPWPWLGGHLFGPYDWSAPFTAMQRSPAENLAEQAASAYRSASGFAVAAILAPFTSITARPTWR